jgi:Secretion system C-terminal sorting domain
MKPIFCLFLSVFLYFQSQAQVACLADTARYRDSTAGVFPLPYDAQLSPSGGINRPACLGKPYRFVFTVKVSDSISVSGTRLALDSIRLAPSGAITGLPVGMSYACNPPSCSFVKNTYGCVLLNGTPAVSNPLNNYNLVIAGSVVIQGFPLSQTFPGALSPGVYTLRLVAANSPDCPPTTQNDEISLNSNLQLMPNPANEMIKIHFNALQTTDLNLKIIDLMGNIWQNEHLRASKGEQNLSINTFTMPNGIYLLQMQHEGKTFIKRFAVQH